MRTVETESLNKLLRGEIAAVESYDQALERFDDTTLASDLVRIRNEHRKAVQELTACVDDKGTMPETTSGGWGQIVKAVETTALLLGTTTAIKALKKGEAFGIKEYEKAIHGPNLDSECKSLIRNKLLPRQRTHVSELDRLLNGR